MAHIVKFTVNNINRNAIFATLELATDFYLDAIKPTSKLQNVQKPEVYNG